MFIIIKVKRINKPKRKVIKNGKLIQCLTKDKQISSMYIIIIEIIITNTMNTRY